MANAAIALPHSRALIHGITSRMGETFSEADAPTARGPQRRGRPRTSAAVINGWTFMLQTAKNVRGPTRRRTPGERRAGHRETAQPTRQRTNQATATAALGR